MAFHFRRQPPENGLSLGLMRLNNEEIVSLSIQSMCHIILYNIYHEGFIFMA